MIISFIVCFFVILRNYVDNRSFKIFLFAEKLIYCFFVWQNFFCSQVWKSKTFLVCTWKIGYCIFCVKLLNWPSYSARVIIHIRKFWIEMQFPTSFHQFHKLQFYNWMLKSVEEVLRHLWWKMLYAFLVPYCSTRYTWNSILNYFFTCCINYYLLCGYTNFTLNYSWSFPYQKNELWGSSQILFITNISNCLFMLKYANPLATLRSLHDKN